MGHIILGDSDIKTEINAAHYDEAEKNCQRKKSTIKTYYNQVKYNLSRNFHEVPSLSESKGLEQMKYSDASGALFWWRR